MFPYYLSIGMTAAQFWEDDPWLTAAYRRASELTSQRRSEEMWLQGLYIHNAVGTVVGNALSKKGAPPKKYIEEPIRVIPMTEAEKEAKAEEERKKVIAYFDRMAKQWDSKSQFESTLLTSY